MSEAGERLAREFIEAFNERRPEAMVARANPDCELLALRSAFEGAFVGHEGLRRWYETYIDAIPDARIEVERVVELGGGRSLVLGRQIGTGAAGGAPFDAPLAGVIELDAEGRLQRMTAYPDEAQAIAAEGS